MSSSAPLRAVHRHAPAPRPPADASDTTAGTDPREPVTRLLRDLRSAPTGLSAPEAARRLAVVGADELTRTAGRSWWRELLAQVVHPLALLLWVAAVLAAVTGSGPLAAAIVAVIVLNAGFRVLAGEPGRAGGGGAARLPARRGPAAASRSR
jgi:magnesium-transporting ATPase (P-type)